MAIDIARISYDPGRQYTGVLAQQGRVNLEAEENEAVAISAAQQRAELVDIIGPTGTPDNGYLVSQGTGFDIEIGPGTIYVGGNRLTLASAVDYASQPDWLDCASDPEGTWSAVPTTAPMANEEVVLIVVQRDVTAVEDPVLREVALGGPDGAARLRLLQHFARFPTQASTCAAALSGQQGAWAKEQGLHYLPASAELASLTRLEVRYQPATSTPQPCEPTVAGGYLGAENQAYRVQVNAVDGAAGTVDLLWGPDDASMLYRVTADGASPPTVTFGNTPVDDYHQPSSGQAVEVLLDAAQLESSDGTVEGYVSSLVGQAMVLSASYQTNTTSLQLPDDITLSGAGTAKQLYLRAWQALLPSVPLGQWQDLAGTGIQVRVTTVANAVAHPGDYWVIAARPETPNAIYPARLGREPQPPDGPLMWACPLAVIGWDDGQMTVEPDCRYHFPPLSSLTSGCCSVSVSPEQGQGLGLQRVINAAVAARPSGQPLTVCLQPGSYTLDRPLLLKASCSGITIEACSGGALLGAAADADGEAAAEFFEGLVIISDATDVTLRGLQMTVPEVPGAATLGNLGVSSDADDAIAGLWADRSFGVGVHALGASGLTVEQCTFYMSPVAESTTNDPTDAAGTPSGGQQGTEPVASGANATGSVDLYFQAGVLARGECDSLVLRGNTFEPLLRRLVPYLPQEAQGAQAPAEPTSEPELDQGVDNAGQAQEPSGGFYVMATSAPAESLQPLDEQLSMTVGFWMAPALISVGATPTAAANTSLYVSSVDGLVVSGNTFSGLGAAVVVFADIGSADITGNVADGCDEGFALITLRAQAAMDLVNAYEVTGASKSTDFANVQADLQSSFLDPAIMLPSILGRTLPLPSGYTPPSAQLVAPGTTETAVDNQKATAALLAGVINQLAATTTGATATATATSAAGPAAPDPSASGAAPAGTATAGDSQTTTPQVVKLVDDEDLSALQEHLLSAHLMLGQFEQGLVNEESAETMQVRIAGNDVSCTGGQNAGSGTALTVWDMVAGTAASEERLGQYPSLIVQGNRLVAQATGYAVTIIGDLTTTFNGNIVVNGYEKRLSARLLGKTAAVTGNVFDGKPALPARSLASPFNTWLPFNEVL